MTGSHASTLDRLYAWEKKLYLEVKVCSQMTTVLHYSGVYVVCHLADISILLFRHFPIKK
jgi:hypothetical protein